MSLKNSTTSVGSDFAQNAILVAKPLLLTMVFGICAEYCKHVAYKALIKKENEMNTTRIYKYTEMTINTMVGFVISFAAGVLLFFKDIL